MMAKPSHNVEKTFSASSSIIIWQWTSSTACLAVGAWLRVVCLAGRQPVLMSGSLDTRRPASAKQWTMGEQAHFTE